MVQFRLLFSENKNRKHVVECFPVCKSSENVFPVRVVLGLVWKVVRLDKELCIFSHPKTEHGNYIHLQIRGFLGPMLRTCTLKSPLDLVS